MAGNLTFDQLKKSVASGDIDTVLACAVDMQGRLVGKRFLAKFFVESGYDETHGCNYLLANDIDMEPVPGYKAASWAQGYGDFVMKPDLATIRNIPWLEKTALVLCDLQDHHTHEDLPHSPRAILRLPGSRSAAMSVTSPPSWNFTCSTRAMIRRAENTGRASRPRRPTSATT
jgi:glutamine synthetase